MRTLNEVYSSLSTRRRYEVWFIRLGLADGSGAWWFRYLLTNPGRDGCPQQSRGMPVQVWATWFPSGSPPQSFIKGFSLQDLSLSARGESPFHFRVANNAIDEQSCRGAIEVDALPISWELHYHSTFRITLSNKGWIGFSRTPHSDAVFSGEIKLGDRTFAAEPLGYGVQGHNCGYRHRNRWSWTHVYFDRGKERPSTLEALTYEMPFGFVFRKCVFWHHGEQHVFRKLREHERDRNSLHWKFNCSSRDGSQLEVAIDGGGGSVHRCSYVKTDCTGVFELANNSLAQATVRIQEKNGGIERLETSTGAVLEMVGD